MTQRRRFLHTAGLALLSTASGRAASRADLVKSIDKEVLRAPPVKKGTWFHPRACRIQNGEVLMTLQPIQGSDFFGHVHYITTKDQGRSWSEFKPIPSLGWEPMAEGGHDAVCDVTPEFHPQTGSVLALGHNVIYKTDRFHKDQPPRWPVYAVYKDGQWGPKKKLVWDDPRGSYIYSNNCGQRHVTPSGEVMMSFTFGVKGQPRSVCGVRCSFDGKELVVRETGNALTNTKGRGLLEPSITHHVGKYWLTLRAEDGRGYVSTSRDGLQYEPQRAWAWEDGSPLDMSTTQQHWLTHSEGLFLVYTRKDETNLNVMRWRAPLWVAQVDTERQCLIRATEKVLLPLLGDGVNAADQVPMMGNFGVANISPEESWVTDGSWCPKRDNAGELQLARVRWSRVNQAGEE